MTPLQFEARHAAVWQELEAALAPSPGSAAAAPADRARSRRSIAPRASTWRSQNRARIRSG
jgi:hypothetical protein